MQHTIRIAHPYPQDDDNPSQAHSHQPETNLSSPHEQDTNLSIALPQSPANTNVEDLGHDGHVEIDGHRPGQEDQQVEPPKTESKDGKESENISDKESHKDKQFMHGFMKEVMGKTLKGEAGPPSPLPSAPFKWPEITDHPALNDEIKPDGRSNTVEHHNEDGKQETNTEGPATSHVTKIGDTWHYTGPDKRTFADYALVPFPTTKDPNGDKNRKQENPAEHTNQEGETHHKNIEDVRHNEEGHNKEGHNTEGHVEGQEWRSRGGEAHSDKESGHSGEKSHRWKKREEGQEKQESNWNSHHEVHEGHHEGHQDQQTQEGHETDHQTRVWHSWKFGHKWISEYIRIKKFTRTNIRIYSYQKILHERMPE